MTSFSFLVRNGFDRFEEDVEAISVKLIKADKRKLSQIADKVKGMRYREEWIFTTFG